MSKSPSPRRRLRHQQRDVERRVLIGARLRREEADRYRAAARRSGRTLYRFVVDALEREATKEG